jgi:hypothetical protein
MTRPSRILIATTIAGALAAWRAPAAAQETGLTGAPQIARAYDAIFDARFAAIPGLLRETCPPAPDEVCRLLDVVALWWRIQLDPLDPSRDAAFRGQADVAVALMDAWTAREPRRAEAWFYLGGAYGARAQWRVLRGARLAAARDGKRIKDALERALQLDPMLRDAYFGIGLYHYYADVAPAALRVLRFLLLLPGGDRALGLEEMLRARAGGQLLRSEADYQLHLIYLWYEKQPARALELLRGLRERHPRNPHFIQRVADVHDVYYHDASASLQTWRELLDAARRGEVNQRMLAEATARLGAAVQLERLGQHDDAAAELRAVVASQAAAPYGAVAQAQLQLARVLAAQGDRAQAEAAYRAAIDAAPPDDPAEIADRARDGMRALRR